MLKSFGNYLERESRVTCRCERILSFANSNYVHKNFSHELIKG